MIQLKDEDIISSSVTLSILKDVSVKAIVDSLRLRPDEWKWNTQNHFALKHRTGVIVQCHFGDYSVEQPYPVKFGFINRLKLRRACRRWKKTKGRSLKERSEMNALMGVIQSLS